MSFHEYLRQLEEKAAEEKAVLDSLASKEVWDPIETRAARSSIQILIEAMIGKSKKILKHFNCPVVPQRAKDALYILHEVGAIGDEEYKRFSAAIGFRNVLIHDYLDFDEKVLFDLVKNGDYLVIYDFLMRPVDLKEVVIKRIEHFIY
ncbi:type VII toxin-antitoxin system HepT family RNase toxin [Hydrogenimonas sp.]